MQEPFFYKAADGTHYMVIQGRYYRQAALGWRKMRSKPDTTDWPDIPPTATKFVPKVILPKLNEEE